MEGKLDIDLESAAAGVPGPQWTCAKLRVGLVGCGRLAELGYVPAAAGSAGVQIVAVADPDLERCRAVAPPARAYSSAGALVAAGGVDALVLATPVGEHLADARLAAAAGLPVLVEKPPGRDFAEAAALAELAPEPWVGFNRRFDPCVERIAAAIPRHEPARLELNLRYRRASWAPHVVCDDALLDLGPHLVDLATWLTRSQVLRVRALDLHHARATLELELGRGSARVECASDRTYRERFAVEAGSRSSASGRGGLVANVLTRLRPGRPHPLQRSLRRQIDAFALAARGGDAGRLATAADAAHVMAVIDAARRSGAGCGDWIDVPGAPLR